MKSLTRSAPRFNSLPSKMVGFDPKSGPGGASSHQTLGAPTDPNLPHPHHRHFVMAGFSSGCMTRFLCHPLDVLKIRFQLQIEPISKASANSKYRTVTQTFSCIVREESLYALWKGHVSAQILSGIYGNCRNILWMPNLMHPFSYPQIQDVYTFLHLKCLPNLLGTFSSRTSVTSRTLMQCKLSRWFTFCVVQCPAVPQPFFPIPSMWSAPESSHSRRIQKLISTRDTLSKLSAEWRDFLAFTVDFCHLSCK